MKAAGKAGALPAFFFFYETPNTTGHIEVGLLGILWLIFVGWLMWPGNKAS